jgi:hypothetical protein
VKRGSDKGSRRVIELHERLDMNRQAGESVLGVGVDREPGECVIALEYVSVKERQWGWLVGARLRGRGGGGSAKGVTAHLSTSVVNCESRPWTVTALCWCNSSSLFCWIAGLWRWRAFLRKTGQTPSRCGQAAQNQEGMRPVGAVDTR